MSDMLRITVPHEGDVVGDLKTGETLEWSWQPMCVQLAIYAHGDNVYRQGPAVDGSEDERADDAPRVTATRPDHPPAGRQGDVHPALGRPGGRVGGVRALDVGP